MALLGPQAHTPQQQENATRASPAERDAIAGAVRAFLAQQTVPTGFVETSVAGYRALCRLPAGGATAGSGAPLLLASDDGAAYLPAGPTAHDEPSSSSTAVATVEAALRANRYRPAGGTLAIRLPAGCGGGTGTFDLWASPRYLAAAGQAEPLWK